MDTLKKRLDPMLAVQDFRHASQGPHESIADYISHLEKMLRTAYSREGMSTETQEGLKYALMESPAVSGATDYNVMFINTQ